MQFEILEGAYFHLAVEVLPEKWFLDQNRIFLNDLSRNLNVGTELQAPYFEFVAALLIEELFQLSLPLIFDVGSEFIAVVLEPGHHEGQSQPGGPHFALLGYFGIGQMER